VGRAPRRAGALARLGRVALPRAGCVVRRAPRFALAALAARFGRAAVLLRVRARVRLRFDFEDDLAI